MRRRDFIKAMAAAAAYPVFMDASDVAADLVLPAVVNPPPGSLLTGLSWLADSASGHQAFNPLLLVPDGQIVRVETPWLGVSRLRVYVGDTLFYDQFSRGGIIRAVYLHHSSGDPIPHYHVPEEVVRRVATYNHYDPRTYGPYQQ